MNREELSLLLYLETRAVDHGGAVDLRHMNDADCQIAKQWAAKKYIEWGRIYCKDCTAEGTYWVRLSDAARRGAVRERRARADRMWKKRTWRTTGESKEDC